jgi:carboxyl-terminal processing protease
MKLSQKLSDLPLLKFCVLLSFLVFASFATNAQRHDPKKSDQKFAAALQIIRFAYVDTVNEEKLTEAAITAMLKELDPHSTYMSKEEVEKANEPLQGNFEGIGVQFEVIKDTIIVVTPVPGGPSEKLGIQSGDKIVKIDGEDATGSKVTSDYVVSKLRGPKGSEVTIAIFRKNSKKLLDYTITRDKIPIFSVDAAYMAAPGVGYIKLNKFAATTMEEFKTAMSKLKGEGMTNLILDLQNNSGGYLNTAIDLADEFLPEGKLEVYTEGYFSPKQENFATSAGDFEKGRLVILVNEGSASASEILAGAVQDWDRAIIIGRRTFGKGLVQRPYNLPDGSVIRLTTAHYYTPTGRCVQKPYDEGVDKYYEDLTKRYQHGEYVNPDSIKFPDSLKYYTPNKRIVYGGGGIMPDIFIALDTTRSTEFYNSVIRKGILNEFIQKYLEKNRDQMKKSYPTVDAFVKNFSITNDFMTEFTDFAAQEGVKKDDEQFAKSEKYLSNLLKARLAQNLWDFAAFWQVYNESDDVYNRALQIIQDKAKFKELKIND